MPPVLSSLKKKKLSLKISPQEQRFSKKSPFPMLSFNNMEEEVIEQTPEFQRQNNLSKFNDTLINSNECPTFAEEDILGKGGFGETALVNGKVAKIMKNFTKQYIKTRHNEHWEWIYNRYQNFCNDMESLTGELTALFPNNFIKMSRDECGFCTYVKNNDEKEVALYANMNIIENNTGGDLQKHIIGKKVRKFTNKELETICGQIYYIIMVMTKNDLYHNDLKAQNVMVKTAKNDIIYDNLEKDNTLFTLTIKKGDLVPVLIDYDFLSNEQLEPGFPADGVYTDLQYFFDSIQKNRPAFGNISLFNKLVDTYDEIMRRKSFDALDVNKAKEAYEKHFGENFAAFEIKNQKTSRKSMSLAIPNIDMIERGRKRTKKVRKHQGIVQTGGNAGRLRKGYRYSGKKLKSGLPQIIKCKSKKC